MLAKVFLIKRLFKNGRFYTRIFILHLCVSGQNNESMLIYESCPWFSLPEII